MGDCGGAEEESGELMGNDSRTKSLRICFILSQAELVPELHKIITSMIKRSRLQKKQFGSSVLPSFVFYVLSPRVTLRNPGSSGRKERPEAGTGSWLGRTRNQVINSLRDHFHPGTDFCGILWIVIIIVFLGISTLAIFLWKTRLCVSFLKTVLKSRNVHDRSTDVQRRAWRSNSRSQEGIKISMEDLYTSWRYMEAKVPAEVHKVMMKVNSHYKINGQRKTAKEEKLFHAAERLRRQAEDYYRRKITPSARKPHANWLCAQALQRKMAERKAAYKQQR
ncbi:nuclear pore complex-interacting protein family member B9-like [Nomascus leucogenys]|uniref:nuclear pore complex-interacting protein family member B9-like n=1 Tax=Nomascus leucogenys TaxID=61853 RepID=UPI00122DC451|nr:nuclear pore complex-interacting protein family member B9-like [Nomascus leucogenys]